MNLIFISFVWIWPLAELHATDSTYLSRTLSRGYLLEVAPGSFPKCCLTGHCPGACWGILDPTPDLLISSLDVV